MLGMQNDTFYLPVFELVIQEGNDTFPYLLITETRKYRHSLDFSCVSGQEYHPGGTDNHPPRK